MAGKNFFVNPLKKKNRGLRSGKTLVKPGKVIRKDKDGYEILDDYFSDSESDADYTLKLHKSSIELQNSIEETDDDRIIQSQPTPVSHRNTRNRNCSSYRSTASSVTSKISNSTLGYNPVGWLHNKNYGRRTGKHITAGKNIRKRPDGFEVFEDYFSESDADSLMLSKLSDSTRYEKTPETSQGTKDEDESYVDRESQDSEDTLQKSSHCSSNDSQNSKDITRNGEEFLEKSDKTASDSDENKLSDREGSTKSRRQTNSNSDEASFLSESIPLTLHGPEKSILSGSILLTQRDPDKSVNQNKSVLAHNVSNLDRHSLSRNSVGTGESSGNHSPVKYASFCPADKSCYSTDQTFEESTQNVSRRRRSNRKSADQINHSKTFKGRTRKSSNIIENQSIGKQQDPNCISISIQNSETDSLSVHDKKSSDHCSELGTKVDTELSPGKENYSPGSNKNSSQTLTESVLMQESKSHSQLTEDSASQSDSAQETDSVHTQETHSLSKQDGDSIHPKVSDSDCTLESHSVSMHERNSVHSKVSCSDDTQESLLVLRGNSVHSKVSGSDHTPESLSVSRGKRNSVHSQASSSNYTQESCSISVQESQSLHSQASCSDHTHESDATSSGDEIHKSEVDQESVNEKVQNLDTDENSVSASKTILETKSSTSDDEIEEQSEVKGNTNDISEPKVIQLSTGKRLPRKKDMSPTESTLTNVTSLKSRTETQSSEDHNKLTEVLITRKEQSNISCHELVENLCEKNDNHTQSHYEKKQDDDQEKHVKKPRKSFVLPDTSFDSHDSIFMVDDVDISSQHGGKGEEELLKHKNTRKSGNLSMAKKNTTINKSKLKSDISSNPLQEVVVSEDNEKSNQIINDKSHMQENLNESNNEQVENQQVEKKVTRASKRGRKGKKGRNSVKQLDNENRRSLRSNTRTTKGSEAENETDKLDKNGGNIVVTSAEIHVSDKEFYQSVEGADTEPTGIEERTQMRNIQSEPANGNMSISADKLLPLEDEQVHEANNQTETGNGSESHVEKQDDKTSQPEETQTLVTNVVADKSQHTIATSKLHGISQLSQHTMATSKLHGISQLSQPASIVIGGNVTGSLTKVESDTVGTTPSFRTRKRLSYSVAALDTSQMMKKKKRQSAPQLSSRENSIHEHISPKTLKKAFVMDENSDSDASTNFLFLSKNHSQKPNLENIDNALEIFDNLDGHDLNENHEDKTKEPINDQQEEAKKGNKKTSKKAAGKKKRDGKKKKGAKNEPNNVSPPCEEDVHVSAVVSSPVNKEIDSRLQGDDLKHVTKDSDSTGHRKSSMHSNTIENSAGSEHSVEHGAISPQTSVDQNVPLTKNGKNIKRRKTTNSINQGVRNTRSNVNKLNRRSAPYINVLTGDMEQLVGEKLKEKVLKKPKKSFVFDSTDNSTIDEGKDRNDPVFQTEVDCQVPRVPVQDIINEDEPLQDDNEDNVQLQDDDVQEQDNIELETNHEPEEQENHMEFEEVNHGEEENIEEKIDTRKKNTKKEKKKKRKNESQKEASPPKMTRNDNENEISREMVTTPAVRKTTEISEISDTPNNEFPVSMLHEDALKSGISFRHKRRTIVIQEDVEGNMENKDENVPDIEIQEEIEQDHSDPKILHKDDDDIDGKIPNIIRRRSSIKYSPIMDPISVTPCIVKSKTNRKSKERRVTISRKVIETSFDVGSATGSSGNSTEQTLNATDGPPVHFCEITNTTTPEKICNPQLNKIISPEPAQDGLRRSQRTRVHTLEGYKLERPIYERRKSGGFAIVGIKPSVSEGKLKALEMKRQNRLKSRKGTKTNRRLSRRLSTHVELPSTLDTTISTEITVHNPDSNQDVLVECIGTKEQAVKFGPKGQETSPNDSFFMTRSLSQPAFGSGVLQISGLQEKPMQIITKGTLIFHIMFGKLMVMIESTNVILSTGDSFFVPRGNRYSIKNLRKDNAKLHYVLIKEEESETESDES